MMNFAKVFCFSVILLLIANTGCKNASTETAGDWTSTEDKSMTDLNSDIILKEVDNTMTQSGMHKGNYPIVIFDTLGILKRVTTNYGANNLMCADGNYRKGTLIVTFTGRYRDIGTELSIEYDHFYQNNNKIQGKKTITNLPIDQQNHSVVEVVSIDTIVLPTGETHVSKSNYIRTWMKGQETKDWKDDIYQIVGTSSGVNRKSLNYSSKILEPLVCDMSCNWRIVKGTMNVIPEGKPTRIVDFGNGKCTSTIKVSVNGKEYSIERKK